MDTTCVVTLRACFSELIKGRSTAEEEGPLKKMLITSTTAICGSTRKPHGFTTNTLWKSSRTWNEEQQYRYRKLSCPFSPHSFHAWETRLTLAHPQSPIMHQLLIHRLLEPAILSLVRVVLRSLCTCGV